MFDAGDNPAVTPQKHPVLVDERCRYVRGLTHDSVSFFDVDLLAGLLRGNNDDLLFSSDSAATGDDQISSDDRRS